MGNIKVRFCTPGTRQWADPDKHSQIRIPVFCRISGGALVRPRTEQSGVRSECGGRNVRARAGGSDLPLYAAPAAVVLPRVGGRARASPHRRHRRLCLAARYLRMESSRGRTLTQVHRQKDRLTGLGRLAATQCRRPRNLFRHPRPVGHPRDVHSAPMGRRAVDAFTGRRHSSLPGAAAALHHAATSAAAGQS